MYTGYIDSLDTAIPFPFLSQYHDNTIHCMIKIHTHTHTHTHIHTHTHNTVANVYVPLILSDSKTSTNSDFKSFNILANGKTSLISPCSLKIPKNHTENLSTVRYTNTINDSEHYT